MYFCFFFIITVPILGLGCSVSMTYGGRKGRNTEDFSSLRLLSFDHCSVSCGEITKKGGRSLLFVVWCIMKLSMNYFTMNFIVFSKPLAFTVTK